MLIKLLLLYILSFPLLAKNTYIKVIYLSSKDKTPLIEYKLNKLGYNIHIVKYKKWLRIYTGPFLSHSEAKIALEKIRENIYDKAFISSIKTIKNDIYLDGIYRDKKAFNDAKPIVETKTKTQAKIETQAKAKIINKKDITPKTQSNFFVGISIGMTNFSVKEKNLEGDLALNYAFDDDGSNYEILLGYRLDSKFEFALSYQQTDLNQINFREMATALNYSFESIYGFKPYLGLLGGFSIMTYQEKPISQNITNDLTSSAFFIAIQGGLSIPITLDWSIYSFYRYYSLQHETDIDIYRAHKVIEHQNKQNFNLGLRYDF